MALAVAELHAVGLVRHAAAGPVGLGHAREHAADAGQHVGERRDVRRVLLVAEHAGVIVGQRAAARRRVDDLEQAGDRLLLEPLAGVARGDPGPLGQLLRGEGAVALERAVEAELDAEVDGEQLERAEGGAEQPLDEGVGAVDGYGHG